jgi:glycerate kinase
MTIDWNAVKAEVSVKTRNKTDMTFIVRDAAKVIMADGGSYTVGSIRAWVEAGLNAEAQAKDPNAERIEVNWSTVKYSLKATPGMVEASKNTFKYDATKSKKVPKK